MSSKKHKMTTREKLDASHEARQWFGLGLSATALYAALNPEGAKKAFSKGKEFVIKGKDKVVDTYNGLKKKF